MAAIFKSGSQTPTQINKIQINQSVLGYPLPVVMGKGKVQQSLLWIDGLKATKESAGGKGVGGGKGGTVYLYTADVVAALCNGPISGIGDVWSGQSWLSNSNTTESYTVSGGATYTPSNASSMASDMGVTAPATYSGSYNDLGAPTPTVLSGTDAVGFQRVTFGSSLATGQYSIDPASNTYHFSSADAGKTVTVAYSFNITYIKQQENDIVPSAKTIPVGGTFTFEEDDGVIYVGGINDGVRLTKVSGTPTVTGTYSVSGSGPATYHFAPGDIGVEVQITYKIQNNSIVPTGASDTLSFSVFEGNMGQAVWSLLTSTFPQAAFAYTGVAYVAYDPMTLGMSTDVQQNVFEVMTPDAFGGGILDCNPVQCILQVLTNKVWGLGTGAVPFPVSAIDNGPGGTWGSSLAAAQAVVALRGAANASGGNTVYNVALAQSGLLTPGALVGNQYKIGGFSHAANNGTFTVVSNTGISVTLNNAAGVSETGATATATPVQGQRTANGSAWNWFASNSFFISPVIDHQDTASSLISKWLEAGMCAAFMSEGLLKLVPYGDTTTAANGCTWTAPSSFPVALDDTCYLPRKGGEDPVKISTGPWQDAYNTVQVQWNNRNSQYAPEITPESIQSAINRYGARIEDPQSWDFITTLPAATYAASIRVKRMVYTRNGWNFALPFNYSYLEPMDVVPITTDSVWNGGNSNVNLGVVNKLVRIIKVVDNPGAEGLQITAEDYPFGVHQPTIYNKDLASGETQQNLFANPGDSEVVLFEATNRLTGFAGNEIWMGATGGKDWGACNVLVSQDGTTYQQVGTIDVRARLGVLDSTFANGADPDTTHSLVVDLAVNSEALESGTSTDADSGNTLCFVDGEIIAYSAATLTGQDQYTLGTYIRRAQRGSVASSHAAGGLFLRLDDTVFKYTYDPSWAGQTLHFKFQSVNAFGNATQDPSTLTPVSFTVPGLNPGTVDASTGLVIGAAAGQGQCPVSTPTVVTASLSSGGLTSAWTPGNAVVQPGTVEFDVYSTGGIVDVLLWASNDGSAKPNGYMLRFDGRVGFVPGQVLIVTSGAWGNIDTAKAPANSGALMGWHHVKAQIGNGQMDVFVDGIYSAMAIDRTYAPTGATYYGYEVTAGPSIAPTGMTQKTQDNLPDGTTYARVQGTALTSGNVDPTKAGVLMKGSLPPSLNGGFTYTATTTSVTWAWPANTAVYRADGTVTLIGAGSQTIAGLVTGRAYFFYPIYNEGTGTLKFIGSADVTFPSVVGYTGDGTTGYVDTTTAVTQPGSISVECWINTTSSAPQPLFDVSAPQVIGTAGNKSFTMWFQNSTISAFGLLGSSVITSMANVAATAKLNDGNTHHIVLTWDNAAHTCNVYVDGVLQTNGSTPASAFSGLSSMFWHIGGLNGKTGWTLTANTFATASISNAAVYNSVLSAAQVQAHYQAMLNISVAQYNSLVAGDSPVYWWKLNETSGTVAADSAGSNTGTYKGTVTLNVSNEAYGASGTPAIAWVATSYLAVQASVLQGNVPLTSGSVSATPTSGGSGGGGGVGGGGGGGGCFSPNTLVKTRRGEVRFDELRPEDMVLTANGTWRGIAKILTHDWTRPMLDMGHAELITYKHHVLQDGEWIAGVNVFGQSRDYQGHVWNLEVDTEEPEGLGFSPYTERSYTLGNGWIVHNGPVGSK